MTKGLVLAAAAALIATLVFGTTASAQYPPPKGSLSCLSAKLSGSGSQYTVSATMIDGSGRPAAGVTVVFAISSQSGGFSLSQSSSVTDREGKAFTTLFRASDAGSVVVTAQAPDGNCRVSLTSEVKALQPPRAGDAGLAAERPGSGSLALYAVIAVLGSAALTLIVWRSSGIRRPE
jgi:FlaG/FlaF family flagellin (archaellin)